MKTQIITRYAPCKQRHLHSTFFKIGLATVMLFFISAAFSSAQQSVTPIAPLTSVYAGNDFQKQLYSNQVPHALKNAGPMVRSTFGLKDAFTSQYLKEVGCGVKHTGLSFLGNIIGFTKIAFKIPCPNKSLRAYLSLKTDRIAIEPKGPGNFQYAAISFKIKF